MALWPFWMKPAFAEKQFFKFRKIVFFAHAWTASNPLNIYILYVDRVGKQKPCSSNNLEKT